MTRLNIGAGHTRLDGFVNIDRSPRADVVLNLDDDRLPFEDGSVELIFTYHCIEHVRNYLFALGEMHRVLVPGGWLLVGVPYVTQTEYNLVNPYHLQHFNEGAFDFFDPQKLQGSAAEDATIHLRKVFHQFHYMSVFRFMPWPLRGLARRHLMNVVKRIDFGLVKVDAEGRLPAGMDEGNLEARMRRQFGACKLERRPHDGVEDEAHFPRETLARRYLIPLRDWWIGYRATPWP